MDMDDLLGGVSRRSRRSKSKGSRHSKSKSSRRSKSKGSRRSKSKGSRRSSGSRRSTIKKKKTYTRVTKDGKDLGGEYTGTSPSDAARKAAKRSDKLPEKGNGEATICVRQVTRGTGHGKVICYKAKQTMVPPTEHMIKVWGRDPKQKVRKVDLTKLK
jgi:hypothetical protein